jgi:hypothetical protein
MLKTLIFKKKIKVVSHRRKVFFVICEAYSIEEQKKSFIKDYFPLESSLIATTTLNY